MNRFAAAIAILAPLTLCCTTTKYAGPLVTPAAVETVRQEGDGGTVFVERVRAADQLDDGRSLTLVRTNDTQTIIKAPTGWS